MSDTPRMKAAQMAAMEHGTGNVYRVGCDIERELNAAQQRIKQLEAVTNDPHALWVNWLRGNVKLPEGIGDVREYQARIKRLEEAGNALLWYFCPKNTGDISFLQSEAIKQWNKAKEDKL